MSADLTDINRRLKKFDRLIKNKKTSPWRNNLRVGVDLGTANVVLSVIDENNNPVAGITTKSQVVRDGIVIDYTGAVFAVSKMKQKLEQRLGVSLTRAAVAIPPGIIEGNVRCMGNVVEGAGFEITALVDEPTVAATALGITSGAVVDVGGGTTGVSILEDGKVVFTGDEATGGFHMTLVLAGYYKCSIEEAEKMKQNLKEEQYIFPIIRPVVEKMGSIVSGYLSGYQVEQIYVVGGACGFTQFEKVFEKQVGIPTVKPDVPLLVTPFGTAMSG